LHQFEALIKVGPIIGVLVKDQAESDFDLKAYLLKWRDVIDGVLDGVLPRVDEYPASVHEAMRYSVFAGGKRLRPILCMAGCEAVGGSADLALNTAAAIEMVHTYSLIHDDLPAMDDDDLRRGKLTCHKEFGEPVAILAGDGLLTEAFGVIVSSPGLDAWVRNVAVAELVMAAGVRGMVSGQVVDMEKEGRNFNKKDVEFIHLHKTAAMISMSTAVGGIIGLGSEEEVDALREYGWALGLAFQIKDDVLNVTGGKELGKGVGTDADRGKATYPALVGVEKSTQRARELCGKAKEALSGLDHRARPLRAIADHVVERDR
jgi:geranylgeranyl diphosphate synthase type II